MSVHVSSWAWRSAGVSGGDLLVLLALADMSNDDAKAWPSQKSLAERSRLTDRQVRRCLVNLVSAGLIRGVGETRAGTIIYEISGYLGGADNMSGGVGRGRPEGADMGVRRIVNEPSQDSPPDPPEGDGDVVRVYEHWREARKKSRANYDKMSPARGRKIRLRLKEFTVEQLCEAIDGVALDPWPERPRHDDIVVIFRSREQVDKFLEMAHTGKDGRPRAPAIERALTWATNVGWEYPDDAVTDELSRFGLTSEEEQQAWTFIQDRRSRSEVA